MTTFGKTTDGSGGSAFGLDDFRGTVFTLPGDGGDITKLTARLYGLDVVGGQVMKGVIYATDGAGGVPGTLKGVSTELTIIQNQAEGWVDFSFASPITLVAGDYCLGLHAGNNANCAAIRRDGTGGTSYYSDTDAYSNGPANPAVTEAPVAHIYCIYATYTPAPPTLTSIETYGVQRGIYTDKECKSLATMTATLQRLVAQSAWYRNAYEVQVTDEAAALCIPGDTGHFVYGDINEQLRILEITRETGSAVAWLKVANIAEDLTDKLESTRKELATLNKSYQGVPTHTNSNFQGQFERTSGGVDTGADCLFFIPYGADLIDLRLRYQIFGMRAFATAVGGGGGTNTPSGGGSTSGSGGGQTSSSGGGQSLTSGATQPNSNSALPWTGGVSTPLLTSGFVGDPVMSGGPLDETDTSYPFTILNETGSAVPDNPHIHSLHNHTHEITNHVHSVYDHIHSASHTHDISSHTHSVTTSDHTHTVSDHTHSTPAHQHALPDHSHTLSYGIHESSIPATVRVYLDAVLITALNDQTIVSDFDLLPYVSKDSNGRVMEGYHTVSFKSATNGATGSVQGLLFDRQFLSTEAA